MFKKKQYWIGGAVVFIAIGFLAYTGFQGSATYYYTLDEFLQQKSAIQDTNVRVAGHVAADSVTREISNLTMQFTIIDGSKSLPVTYKGTVPDTFKPGIDVLIEGRLDKDGIFRATTILTKCPSKYEPQ